ncbi:MAG: hypothetical protein GEV06_08030 [Luteitalea sp.]|nr:hypothetical protein [Luteitalea sp.]
MYRREFLRFVPAAGLLSRSLLSRSQSGAHAVPPPLSEAHFPSRLHQFVWRNWELVNLERMAETVQAESAELQAIADSMGLPEKRVLDEDQRRRFYITVIRQNWHLLPNRQIQKLLGWDAARFEFTLKEDDFLDHKLGAKPQCAPIWYRTPSEEEARKAAAIRATVHETFGEAWSRPGEPPFAFVTHLSEASYGDRRDPGAEIRDGEIDLSSGWRVAPVTGTLLEAAAERLTRYLRHAMGATIAPDAARRIELDVDSSADGIHIETTPNRIRIAASSPEGVIRAVAHVQNHLENRGGPFLEPGAIHLEETWDVRYLYSFFALYGDPLMEPEVDPFPDGYLEKLVRVGINGVWMQAVLNTLAPSQAFPELGKGWETRLENLNLLVDRAARYGIKVYLYLNEPRAMPASFFDRHPEVRGSSHRGLWAMCTSVPRVRDWISDSLAHVMRHTPNLGGFFTISMSENHTNCFSHGGTWGTDAPNAGDCPRCPKRASWDVIAELFTAMRDGIRRESATAQIVHWDWGWGDALAERLIPRLAKDVVVQSVSEWAAPLERGGVKTEVGEYSMSVVGPGPRARRNWRRARRAGVKTAAKVPFNNTWEIAAVPYIPVPALVLRHCENLSREAVSMLMVSWTLGGYPSPNLAAAQAYYYRPHASPDEILSETAVGRYGAVAAPDLVAAWRQFSRAFQEFPYGVHMYRIPTHHGPANLLRLSRVEHEPGMILFPHDAYEEWSRAYPPEVVQAQFRKLSSLWAEGLQLLERAARRTPPSRRRAAELDLAVAHTCHRHFESVANQVEFYRLRARLADQTGDRDAVLQRMREIADEEARLATAQFHTARAHSVIAYEASNHYFYRPLDLAEKVLNCKRTAARLYLTDDELLRPASFAKRR